VRKNSFVKSSRIFEILERPKNFLVILSVSTLSELLYRPNTHHQRLSPGHAMTAVCKPLILYILKLIGVQSLFPYLKHELAAIISKSRVCRHI